MAGGERREGKSPEEIAAALAAFDLECESRLQEALKAKAMELGGAELAAAVGAQCEKAIDAKHAKEGADDDDWLFATVD